MAVDLRFCWVVGVHVGEVAEGHRGVSCVDLHVADTASEDAFALVTETIADHLAVDAPTREVLLDAARAADETLRRQRVERGQ